MAEAAHPEYGDRRARLERRLLNAAVRCPTRATQWRGLHRIQSFWHPREGLCRDSRVTGQRGRRRIIGICLLRAKPLAARPAPFALTARGGKKRNPDAIARLDRR